MSNVSPAVRGSPRQPTRYRTTSRMAIGSHRDDTHRGATIAGRRRVRSRMISNDAEPDPMITAARSSVTGTPAVRSAAPVSWRLRRCSDSSSSAPPSPDR